MIKLPDKILEFLKGFNHQAKFYMLCCFMWAIYLPEASASTLTVANSGGQVPLPSQGQLHRVRECEQRVGPFATQDTAWQRWRQAQSEGYAVSRGVVPCYDGGTRGYCFYVFYPC